MAYVSYISDNQRCITVLSHCWQFGTNYLPIIVK